MKRAAFQSDSDDKSKIKGNKTKSRLNARILHQLEILKALIESRSAATVREAVEGLAPDRRNDLLDISGISLGQSAAGRQIGEPSGTAKGGSELNQVPGFNDPLANRRNSRPRSTVIGPGGFPSSGDTTGQDASASTHYYDGQRRGTVWLERSTSRSSADGTQTWGSNLYRDSGGNHWRVDYHDQLTGAGTADTADDGFTSKETVFDAHNKPVSTTVREALPSGNAKETTTDHQTGETTTRTGTVVEIFPERSQTAEGTGRADAIAPRGWSNPLSGGAQNPGLATDNNQINPGREGGDTTPIQPLMLDPKDLAVNPPLYENRAAGKPRDIRREQDDINQVDPPRPSGGK